MELELTRAQKVGFWMWFALQTKSDMKMRVSEFKLERVAVLR